MGRLPFAIVTRPTLSSPPPDRLAHRSQGFGWAIAKALAEAGAEISLGVWVSVFACALLFLCDGLGWQVTLASFDSFQTTTHEKLGAGAQHL